MVAGHLGFYLGAVEIAFIPLKTSKRRIDMITNGAFREDELVTRKVKINGEWQTRTFPIIGGRLRLAHEQNDSLSLQTELVNWDGQYAVFKCRAVTVKGEFVGYGTANAQRDARLAESLIELAETRSVARALRFSGFGLEFTSAEEVSHVLPETDSNGEQNGNKEQKPVFEREDSQSKPETKAPVQPKNGGNGSGGKATGAQCRALYALSKKAQMGEEDLQNVLGPLNATRFEDLSIADASRLIQYFQTQVQVAA
jgi:hypothetical protein